MITTTSGEHGAKRALGEDIKQLLHVLTIREILATAVARSDILAVVLARTRDAASSQASLDLSVASQVAEHRTRRHGTREMARGMFRSTREMLGSTREMLGSTREMLGSTRETHKGWSEAHETCSEARERCAEADER
jgi:hypothetical protein